MEGLFSVSCLSWGANGSGPFDESGFSGSEIRIVADDDDLSLVGSEESMFGINSFPGNCSFTFSFGFAKVVEPGLGSGKLSAGGCQTTGTLLERRSFASDMAI